MNKPWPLEIVNVLLVALYTGVSHYKASKHIHYDTEAFDFLTFSRAILSARFIYRTPSPSYQSFPRITLKWNRCDKINIFTTSQG